MKRKLKPVLALVALSLLAAGCTTIPTGPSRMALPGTGKDFDQFRVDDASCRQYAAQASGASPTETQQNSAVKSAAVGTAVGAVAGAAIGGNSRGAATGAGVGLLFGALAGASAGDQSGYAVQRRYDNGYVQCMYAKGHRVPVPAGMARRLGIGRSTLYRKLAELGIDIVRQGFENKLPAALDICRELHISPAQVCYIGDDLTDLPVMRAVGLGVAVADAGAYRTVRISAGVPVGHHRLIQIGASEFG